jgi:hypothetical protein
MARLIIVRNTPAVRLGPSTQQGRRIESALPRVTAKFVNDFIARRMPQAQLG